MRRYILMNFIGLISLMVFGITGCGVWPIMTQDEGNRRRPFAMGKSDQVLYPWAPHPVHLNENYGNFYRYALEKQILNPQAGNSLEPLEGMSGQASGFNIERYHKMFKKPPFEAKQEGGGGTILFKGGK